MNARTLERTDSPRPAARPLVAAPASFGGEEGRYRLDVVGTTVADVVENAGGWIFDRCLAGWEVTVLLAEPSDPRALRILGARTVALEPVLASGWRGRRPHGVAGSSGAFDSDGRVRDGLSRASAAHGIDVLMWGAESAQGSAEEAGLVSHRLSNAARTFKAHALRAIGRAASASDLEVFRTDVVGCDPLLADLSPAS